MAVMTTQDAQATQIILIIVSFVWMIYGCNHSDNAWVPVINNFWLGAIVFMIMFYVFFSKNG